MNFRIVLLSMLAALLVCPPGAPGQSTSKGDALPATTQDQPKSAAVLEFEGLRKRLNANRDEIAKLQRTMPIGFPDKVADAEKRIEALKQENAQIEVQVFDKAKAAFMSSETPDRLTSLIMINELRSVIEPRDKDDRFEPEKAIELVSAMLEKFPEDIRLMRYGFLANFAVERFDAADALLAKMESIVGEKFPTAYRESLEKTNEKYQRELKIRRLENSTDDLPQVRLVTTEGDILVELFENHAPNTVANFISLIEQQFYNDRLFHLVRPGQYAITGSPNGDGSGSAGYRIRCECEAPEIRHHFRGTLTMLTSGKDQGGSQFMILHQPNTRLYDGKYTAFGRVLEGMDVVMKLKNVDLSGRTSTTADVSKIVRTEIVRKRAHPYVPEKIDLTGAAPTVGTGNPATGALGSGSKSDSTAVVDDDAAGSFDLLLEQDKK